MNYLPPKNVGDRVDYIVDFADLIPEGFIVDSHSIEITSSGDGESPMELEVSDSTVVAEDSPSEERVTEVQFWLTGGIVGTWYELKITVSDSESTDPDRTYERYFRVQVKNNI